jgi:hypothetical protein
MNNKNLSYIFNSITQNKKEINNLDTNRPLLFSKKIKKVTKKKLNIVINDTGRTRHFTPAAQEWINSIYVYNYNYLKTLPVADSNLMNLLKSYFNSNLKLNTLKNKSKINKRQIIKDKRLSTKRVFVGKGDLKHTNDKVIITIYVYNTEGMYLSNLYKKIKQVIYYPNSTLIKTINLDPKNKKKLIVTYNRRFKLDEITPLPRYEWYLTYVIRRIMKNNKRLIKINKYYDILTNLVKINILSENDKLQLFRTKVLKLKSIPIVNYNSYPDLAKDAWFSMFFRYFYLLNFNKTKFNRTYINKLIGLVKNLYQKNVKFNIVNLKKMHLSSDIYTQAVSLKLKPKGSRLYRVLKSSLWKVKVPKIYKIDEKQGKDNRNELPINKVRNNIISSMFKGNDVKDPLNNLLLNIFPWVDNLKTKSKYAWISKKHSISLQNYLLKHLKHMKLRGVTVEAKGRLTRRLTASRSVFKMKLKGGLKNVESSFKGLSTIMLRGIFKSNVQYSVLNSNNRNGAFGVKGWVSNK